jgi:hypothetical protein
VRQKDSAMSTHVLALRGRSLGSRLRETASLFASLAPGLLFVLGLVLVRADPRFSWLDEPARYPWQLYAIAFFGCAATVAGVWDWIHHRTHEVAVGPLERKIELAALAFGGVPLFGLMAAASVMHDPRPLLVPIVLVLVFTVVAVVYDEVRFHRRRCTPFEHRLHRVLTLGHLGAFTAWLHYVYVEGA